MILVPEQEMKNPSISLFKKKKKLCTKFSDGKLMTNGQRQMIWPSQPVDRGGRYSCPMLASRGDRRIADVNGPQLMSI